MQAMADRPTQHDKGEAFSALHEGEPFVIPNPWDAGSAKAFEAMGFRALATTSGGFAFTLGRMDGNVTPDEVAGHVRQLADASALPISVDLENGYGAEPEAAAKAIRRASEAGAVGGSIEDWDPEGRIYEPEHAAERVSAAAEAAKELDFPFTLTGRAENHLRGNPDLDDTIARLKAYEQAGADVVYAPALRSIEDVHTVAEAVSRPLNVLALRRFRMDELVEAGAQRVSVGASLTFVGMAAVAAAAERIRDEGDFSVLEAKVPLHDWLGG
jgi:2-methylisocitrate lyase-like PEP mutase family enzyme